MVSKSEDRHKALCGLLKHKKKKKKMKNPIKIYLDWVNKNNLNDKKQEYKDCIQVREFNGQLYICYKDIPLIRQDQINGDICKVVQECRQSAIQSIS